VRAGQCRGQLEPDNLAPTTIVAYMTPAYAEAATDTSDPTPALETCQRSRAFGLRSVAIVVAGGAARVP
jgi:hypothetical protein